MRACAPARTRELGARLSAAAVVVGAAGALFLSALPFVCWFIIVPSFFITELVLLFRAPRRFVRGFGSRLAGGLLMLAVAATLPTKPEDTIVVGPLPTSPVTIDELNERRIFDDTDLWRVDGDGVGELRVSFSADRLTLRRFVDELAAQTHRPARIGRCHSPCGTTLLNGAHPQGSVTLE